MTRSVWLAAGLVLAGMLVACGPGTQTASQSEAAKQKAAAALYLTPPDPSKAPQTAEQASEQAARARGADGPPKDYRASQGADAQKAEDGMPAPSGGN
jgi:hypothetical protein